VALRKARRAAAASAAGDPSLVDQVLGGRIDVEAIDDKNTLNQDHCPATASPPALRALKRALAQATEPALREQLNTAIAALELRGQQ
jgi:hypothetical protein